MKENTTSYEQLKEIKWLTGPKGGQYYINEKGKKIYKKKDNQRTSIIKRQTLVQEKRNDNYRTSLSSRTCCCCGKTLSEDDCNYYDLTDYCPRCALADGIISSLE